MTREERALKNLKQMCSDGRYLGSGSYVPLEVLEDFDLAIKVLEQEPTTKNNLGVDAISRKQALRELKESAEHHANGSREEVLLRRDRDIIRALPPVTPQEPRDKIFTKADIDAIVKAINAGWELRVNEVLDKIRAEIEQLRIHKAQFLTNDNKVCIDSQEVLNVIDKYKAESEVNNGNDD